MANIDTQTIHKLKAQRIDELFTQVLLDALLRVLSELAESQKRAPRFVCYKSDCPAREEIPF